LCVLEPVLQGDPIPPHVILELSPFPASEFVYLLEIGEALRWLCEWDFLTINSFSE